jgi:hypothetical protein
VPCLNTKEAEEWKYKFPEPDRDVNYDFECLSLIVSEVNGNNLTLSLNTSEELLNTTTFSCPLVLTDIKSRSTTQTVKFMNNCNRTQEGQNFTRPTFKATEINRYGQVTLKWDTLMMP